LNRSIPKSNIEPDRTCIITEKSSVSSASAVTDFGDRRGLSTNLKLAQATASWPKIAQNEGGTPAIIFVEQRVRNHLSMLVELSGVWA
jgi:hypothetical protein